MYAHKNRCDGRCRIASARLEIGQICEDRFRGHVSYSSIDGTFEDEFQPDLRLIWAVPSYLPEVFEYVIESVSRLAVGIDE